ncbi:phosphonate metabolism protein PhnM [Spirochaeta cellobiosiphila]|uniref:phosphonate metabolism protein PhnM n=1 Tax=Spirochaeta cellobiosiphila TaxID=504483 RepID=UPI00040D438C|nr:phosphonate metabolism protein PhnM [Spirochaeta cellobiosiphila]
MKTILKGHIVTPHKVLPDHLLIMEEGHITEIKACRNDFPDSYIDTQGSYILPGLIDVHSDYIEQIAAPRPSSVMDFSIALKEAERNLIGQGITTMYHSLSFYQSWKFDDKVIRQASHTRRFVELIDRLRRKNSLIRHRFHARFEIDSLDRVEELEDYIKSDMVHLLSFMDHTPGQGQYRNLEVYKKFIKGYRKLSEEEADEVIKRTQTAQKLPITAIQELAQLAISRGVPVASHDDDTIDKLHLNKELSLNISEFPITMEVAKEARRLGFYTVAGAPNILLGGSHSGNLSAAEAILEGAIDTLCSDYYPAAMIHCIFKLHDDYGLSLPEALNLVSLNPAKAVGLEDRLGSLEAGKEADVLVLHLNDEKLPLITSVYVQGQLKYQTHY